VAHRQHSGLKVTEISQKFRGEGGEVEGDTAKATGDSL
jgi:hypothetical protein